MTTTRWSWNLLSLSPLSPLNLFTSQLHHWNFSSINISDEVEDTLRIIRKGYDELAAHKTKDSFKIDVIVQVAQNYKKVDFNAY